jgi:transposase-like protein
LTPDLLELGSGSGRINTMTRKTYPLEFKLDAVALTRENGAHQAQVARDLGVAKTTLLNWVRKAEKEHTARPSLGHVPPSGVISLLRAGQWFQLRRQ